MTRVLIHPEALLDIQDAFEFYEEESTGLGNEFVDVVYRLIGSIRVRPNTGTPANHRSSRGRVLKRFTGRFPYSVVYVLYEDFSTVEVVAVAHGKRKPSYWTERAP
ncbi:MAG: type II toxin-antitoxin system RelE/ParE family toxin [Myxococcota bacterium]